MKPINERIADLRSRAEAAAITFGTEQFVPAVRASEILWLLHELQDAQFRLAKIREIANDGLHERQCFMTNPPTNIVAHAVLKALGDP